MPKRCAIYVRVSTEEQKRHGISIDSQVDALKAFCKDHKYTIVNIYNDAGLSARKSYKHRPELLHLLEDVKQKKIDLILFTKLDRWFRSVPDYYEVQKVLDDYNVPWRAIWEDYETETSSGKFKVNIMLSVAQAESDRTSERIKAVYEYQMAQGIYVGGLPYGYMRDGKRVVKNPEEAPAVDLMFNTYLLTRSTKLATEALMDAGYKIPYNTVRQMLINESYTGHHQNATYEPYISQETYNKIMERRRSFVRSPQKKGRTFLFTGLLYCGTCNSRMESRVLVRKRKDGSQYERINYICIHRLSKKKYEKNTYTAEKTMEKYLIDHIGYELDKYNMYLEMESKEFVDHAEEIRLLKQRIRRVGIRFEEGDITPEEYKEKRSELLEKITVLEADTPEKKKPIILDTDWYTVYNKLDKIHKRAFWFSIIKKIIVEPGKDPVIVFE